jgi:Sulfatase
LKWKLAFEVEWKSTKSLFTPQIPLFSMILILQPILGVLVSSTFRFWLQTKRDTSSSRYYIPLFTSSINSKVPKSNTTIQSTPAARCLNRWIWTILLTIYVILVITVRPLHPWKKLSSNPVGGLAWTTFHPPRPIHNQRNTPPPHWDRNFVKFVSEQISAPEVDLSKSPRAFLKHPIRNVVIINLESVRSDALPFSPKLVEAIGSKMVNENLTSEDITPFWNSLMPYSLIMNDTSATSSYTLKTLLSTFCGIYPLNVNFMEEGREDRYLYQDCLPQLVRESFVSPNKNRRRWWWPRRSPTFRFESAFFQSSENTFDHQEEEFNKMGWDKIFYAKEMGWFGVGDNDLLPLLWDWVDSTLGAKKQILAGILTTSTHYPFPLPEGEEYREYITNEIANQYLNSIRMTDGFLRNIIEGFKERGVFNETMFVMIGDHGHGFDDWNHKVLGALDNPMENGFRVPFMLYSPALYPVGSVDGKYTNLDVLPTIMDALISSSQHSTWDDEYLSPPSQIATSPGEISNDVSSEHYTSITELSKSAENNPLLTTVDTTTDDQGPGENLLDLTVNFNRCQIEQILRRYEGTSVFRQPTNPNHPQRMTFHLDNPGNAHIIMVQYPMKIVHDAIGEQTYLFDLSHDIGEWDDLLSIPINRGNTPPPPWVDWSQEDLSRNFHLEWWIEGTDEFGEGRTLPDRDSSIEYLKPDNETDVSGIEAKLKLADAYDWAEDAFEILLGWSWINRERYLTGSKNVDIFRSTALERFGKNKKIGWY